MTCQTCHAPTDSTYLCTACAADLTSVLEQVPDALETVQDTVARLDRVGTGSGRGTERSRPPVNLDALEHQTHLTELVHSWARMVLETETRDDLRDVEPVTYLRISMHLIVAQDYAGQMHAELKDALRKVQRAADLPSEVLDLSWCDAELDDGTTCAGRMKARKGDSFARCRECGATAPVAGLQAHLIREARHAYSTLSKVCAALAHTPFPVNLDTAKSWVRRGHLVARRRDPDTGEALYTVAEVDEVRRKMKHPRQRRGTDERIVA